VSAAVLAFSGEWQGRFEPRCQTEEQRKDQAAFRNARKIRAAKHEADNWMSRLLVALLVTMPDEQRLKLELTLCTQVHSEDAQQALALVRFASAGREERGRIQTMLNKLEGAEVAL
jgi:hypothetical protein